jgi:predicted HD phosphohydrolase
MNDALMRPGWGYVKGEDLQSISAPDWKMLDAQRAQYLAQRQADTVLAMFRTGADEPSFGYEINMHKHALQTATLMLQAGLPEESVVVGLLHDIAYDISPASHGKAAWAILGPYATERDGWMLAHHQEFQSFHCPNHPDVDIDERERWRGHPHFEYTAEFVAKYDQTTIRADGACLKLETFVPMVRRFFARPARPVSFDAI